VTARLTHGPQRITPAIIAIARRGKNDLPKSSRVCDRDLCARRIILRSFLLRFSCALCLQQGKNGSAWESLEPTHGLAGVTVAWSIAPKSGTSFQLLAWKCTPRDAPGTCRWPQSS
jgi:hypothetical protein